MDPHQDQRSFFKSTYWRSRSKFVIPGTGLDVQVALDDLGCRQKRLAVTLPDGASLLDDHMAIGDVGEAFDVLVDHQDGDACLPDGAKAGPDRLPYERRQSFGRLIEHQEPRIGHQRPADRQHLLLTAGKLVTEITAAFLQLRQQLIDLPQPPCRPPNAPPAFYSTYLLVDPERPFTRVYLVVWDPRAVQMRIMSGTREPESATGATAPGMVPRTPESLNRVVAGFNGGFQSLHGEFGMMSAGRVYLPPKPWAATVAIRDDGGVMMGSWRGPPEGVRHYSERWATRQIPDNMVEFRQNLTSVVENGRWNPWRRWYWGAAPSGDEEQVFIDRSGLCLTEEGFVVYFWGKSMGAEELGKAMLAARCVRGLHLDMNQRHTAFELYHAFERDQPPPDVPRPIDPDMEFEINVPYARGWRVRGRKLVRTMTPMTFPRYIRRDPRDFFYLTLKSVLPGPHLEGSADGEGVFDTRGLPHAGWPHAFAMAWLGNAPTDEEDELPRTRLVRMDPARIFFGSDRSRVPQAPEQPEGSEVDANADTTDVDESARPLAYFTDARDSRGELALYWVDQEIGRRFAVSPEPPEGAQVVMRGGSLAADEVAAVGVDADGFLVYGEAENGDTLAARMTAAGVETPMGLGGIRLAFVVDAMKIGPDRFEREVDMSQALSIHANRTPPTEVLFPDIAPRPYMYWGPMQDSRVRYFRGDGPRRFVGPDSNDSNSAGTPATP